MATTAAELISRTRLYVRDLPLTQDVSTASMSSSVTTLSVADTTRYAVGDPVEVENETMLVRALASATNLTVLRGMFGSTAATHVTASTVVRKPAFFFNDYLNSLNMGLMAMFPKVYQEIIDTSLTGVSDQYEYTIPTMSSPAIVLPFVSDVSLLEAGSGVPYRKTRKWILKRGATSKLVFTAPPNPGDTIRIHGYGPFPRLAAADSTHAQFPYRCEDLLVIYASASLLMSGEAWRVRSDVGMGDDREQANRTGSSAQAGAMLMNRFYNELAQLALPPMPKHAKSVI